MLETLRQTAIIQSTESSNRIEGITVPLARIHKLVTERTTPKDRSEQEITGYRNVLNTIHASYGYIRKKEEGKFRHCFSQPASLYNNYELESKI